MNGQPPQGIDSEAVARYRDASAGGCHGTAAEKDAARRVTALWPKAGEASRRVYEFHERAAAWAVRPGTIGGEPWPAARSVIFAASGYPPSWPRAMPLHARAAAIAPAARFAYSEASPALWRLWQEALAGDPRAVAIEAAAAVPVAVMGRAVAVGLAGPWSVHLQRAAHYWAPDAARDVIAGYAALAGPGSTIAITLCVPATTEAGRRLAAIMSQVAETPAYSHSPEDIAAWVKGAGMVLHPLGVTDVRAWPAGPHAVAGSDRGRAVPPGRFLAAVALVPRG